MAGKLQPRLHSNYGQDLAWVFAEQHLHLHLWLIAPRDVAVQLWGGDGREAGEAENEGGKGVEAGEGVEDGKEAEEWAEVGEAEWNVGKGGKGRTGEAKEERKGGVSSAGSATGADRAFRWAASAPNHTVWCVSYCMLSDPRAEARSDWDSVLTDHELIDMTQNAVTVFDSNCCCCSCCSCCCCSHVSHAIEPCSINLFDLCSRAPLEQQQQPQASPGQHQQQMSPVCALANSPSSPPPPLLMILMCYATLIGVYCERDETPDCATRPPQAIWGRSRRGQQRCEPGRLAWPGPFRWFNCHKEL